MKDERLHKLQVEVEQSNKLEYITIPLAEVF